MPHKLFGTRLNSIYPREATRHYKPTVQKRLLCTATAHRFIYTVNKTGMHVSGFPPGKEQAWNVQHWPQQKRLLGKRQCHLYPNIGTNELQPRILCNHGTRTNSHVNKSKQKLYIVWVLGAEILEMMIKTTPTRMLVGPFSPNFFFSSTKMFSLCSTKFYSSSKPINEK